GTTVFLWVNGTLALQCARRRGRLRSEPFNPGSATPWRLPETLPELIRRVSVRLPWRLLTGAVAAVLGILIAAGEARNWDLVLRSLPQVLYGQHDPLYGKDVGFYLFPLPAYVALKNWMLLTVVLSAVVAGAVYFANGAILFDKGRRWLSPAAMAHGS